MRMHVPPRRQENRRPAAVRPVRRMPSGPAREVREAQGTLADKNTAIAAYDIAFSRASKVLEALFLLAGETALADRVRPSARRPGQTEELAPQPEPAPSEAPQTE